MNIALFTESYEPEINGVATSTANLAKTMRAHGHKVLVVCANPWDDQFLYDGETIRVPGIIELKSVYNYRLAGPYNARAAKLVREFRPDVIHTQSDGGIGMFGSSLANQLHIAHVYTYHTMVEDYTHYVTKGHFQRVAVHFVRAFFREKLKQVDEIIAPSSKIYDYLRNVGIDKTIAVVPTGIELDRFSVEKKDKVDVASLKKKFGIDPEDYVILSLGRIGKEKSIDFLIKGYALFLKNNPSKKTKFVITGFGPAEAELKELAHTLGIEDHVIFTGRCSPSETQRYYHLGDCFVSASLSETQGLTFMEAMAASLPVLARYDDNLVGTIQDGETGFFFFTEEDLAAKLQHVIEMDAGARKRIINNAFKVVDVYSMERFYQNVMEVYRRVVRANW